MAAVLTAQIHLACAADLRRKRAKPASAAMAQWHLSQAEGVLDRVRAQRAMQALLAEARFRLAAETGQDIAPVRAAFEAWVALEPDSPAPWECHARALWHRQAAGYDAVVKLARACERQTEHWLGMGGFALVLAQLPETADAGLDRAATERLLAASVDLARRFPQDQTRVNRLVRRSARLSLHAVGGTGGLATTACRQLIEESISAVVLPVWPGGELEALRTLAAPFRAELRAGACLRVHGTGLRLSDRSAA